MRGLFTKLAAMAALGLFAQACAPTVTAPPVSATVTTVTTVAPTTDSGSKGPMKLTKMSPSSQFLGGSAFLKGTGLTNVAAISLGSGFVTDFFVIDDKSIILVISDTATTGDVTVFDVDGGSDTITKGFTLLGATPTDPLNKIENVWINSVVPGNSSCSKDSPSTGQSTATGWFFQGKDHAIRIGTLQFQSSDNCSGTPDQIIDLGLNGTTTSINPLTVTGLPAQSTAFKLTQKNGKMVLGVFRPTDKTNIYDLVTYKRQDHTCPDNWSWQQWKDDETSIGITSLSDFENAAIGKATGHFYLFPDVVAVSPSPTDSASPSPSPSDSSSSSPLPTTTNSPTQISSPSPSPSANGLFTSEATVSTTQGQTYGPITITGGGMNFYNSSSCTADGYVAFTSNGNGTISLTGGSVSGSCMVHVADSNSMGTKWVEIYVTNSTTASPSPSPSDSTSPSPSPTVSSNVLSASPQSVTRTEGNSGSPITISGGSGIYEYLANADPNNCWNGAASFTNNGDGTITITGGSTSGSCVMKVHDVMFFSRWVDILVTNTSASPSPSPSPTPSPSVSPSPSPSPSPTSTAVYSDWTYSIVAGSTHFDNPGDALTWSNNNGMHTLTNISSGNCVAPYFTFDDQANMGGRLTYNGGLSSFDTVCSFEDGNALRIDIPVFMTSSGSLTQLMSVNGSYDMYLGSADTLTKDVVLVYPSGNPSPIFSSNCGNVTNALGSGDSPIFYQSYPGSLQTASDGIPYYSMSIQYVESSPTVTDGELCDFSVLDQGSNETYSITFQIHTGSGPSPTPSASGSWWDRIASPSPSPSASSSPSPSPSSSTSPSPTPFPFPSTTNRDGLTATKLANGKILLAGGKYMNFNDTTAEIYDPIQNTFTPTVGSMIANRRYHRATLLDSGKVLLSGGSDSSAEVYDPNTDHFTAVTGYMSANRYFHISVKLLDGRVLLAGGFESGSENADLYDPTTNTISPTGTALSVTRAAAVTVTESFSGKVMIAGGTTGNGGTFLNSIEIFDPSDSSFTTLGATLSSTRAAATAAELSDGRIMIAGGATAGWFATSSVDLFDPTNNTVSTSNYSLQYAREKQMMLPVPGKVDQFYFIGSGSTGSNYAEVYSPTNPINLTPVTMGRSYEYQAAAAIIDATHVLAIGGNYNANQSPDYVTFNFPNTISSISPAVGLNGGDSISISGTSFPSNPVVLIWDPFMGNSINAPYSAQCTVSASSSSSITCDLPTPMDSGGNSHLPYLGGYGSGTRKFVVRVCPAGANYYENDKCSFYSDTGTNTVTFN